MRVFNVLSRSYPSAFAEYKALARTSVISLFIGLFLLVFQPFGNTEWRNPNKTLLLMGYSIACLIPSLINHYIIRKLFSGFFIESKWTIGKEVLWLAWMLLFITFFNLLYSYMISVSELSLFSFLRYFILTVLIGIFPISATVILNELRLTRKNSKSGEIMNKMINPQHCVNENSEISLKSDNGKDEIKITDVTFLYAESIGNYTRIAYFESGSQKKTLLRCSLKKIEDQVNHKYIIRSHRSFIVNLLKVKSVTGNSLGYRLQIENTDDIIPVSRNAGKHMHELLKKLAEL